MNIDIPTLSMIVSIVVGIITTVTVIRTNAINQQKTASKIDVIDVKIETLSERVEKHNGVMERTFKLEENVRENSHDIVEVKSDIREIKSHLMKG